ncbi:MAG: NUDIX domain-containing protein [Bacteroidales bacterium]
MVNGKIRHFNIRVYGLVINNRNEILLTDEFQIGQAMTKFPGGGLQFGEGTIDCIKREAIEEFGQTVEVVEHFYTTDFFQKALFYEDHQLISIYYIIRFVAPLAFKVSEKPFDFRMFENGNQSFRWKKICELTPDDLSLPVDKHVAALVKQKYCLA